MAAMWAAKLASLTAMQMAANSDANLDAMTVQLKAELSVLLMVA